MSEQNYLEPEPDEEESDEVKAREAIKLAKLKAMPRELHLLLEMKFWQKIGPAFRKAQPDIKLPFDDCENN